MKAVTFVLVLILSVVLCQSSPVGLPPAARGSFEKPPLDPTKLLFIQHFMLDKAVACITTAPLFAQEQTQSGDIEKILSEFVNDYKKNDALPEKPITFGIQIKGDDGGKWTAAVDKNSPEKVTLKKGFPDTPTFFIVTDLPTLKKIYNGEMNALTAAGRARMSDKTPLDIGIMEGFRPAPDFFSKDVLPLAFHFFNRGKPEIIRFGEKYSRLVHGGNAVVFYYQPGLRTAWYQLKKGMMINKDLEDAANPFPTLLIITKGTGEGRLGDKTLKLEEGMTIFIPAGMIHQFTTKDEQGMEAIIIMFGEGA